MHYNKLVVVDLLLMQPGSLMKMRLLNSFLIVFSLFFSILLPAQNADGLVARYTFDNADTRNEIGEPAKAIGVSYCEDRFGHSRSACTLHGNSHSYLNLGTDKALKPSSGSISLWVKVTAVIQAGSGAQWNPIIMTKNGPGDDFFESYAIVLDIQTRKLAVTNSQSEMEQLAAHASEPITKGRWYHVVFTFDDKSMCFYLDGEQQDCLAKPFHTEFLTTDSVMIGNSANKKNNRFFSGAIDDLRIYNRVLSHEDIVDIYEKGDPRRFYPLIGAVLITLTIILLTVIILTKRFKLALAREKEKSKVQSQMYEMEMRVIKAQMNPHFIFNSMNSIQQFILAENTVSANTYLVKFSRLLRKILESNTEEFITVENEIDILNKYIEMEALRFSQSFSYEIVCDERLIISNARIPQMLIQPFVENAIWHGLLPKKGDKSLAVKFEYINDKLLSCLIEDNGIGYNPEKTPDPLTKSKSLGILFIKQRLELMKRMCDGDYSLTITYKTDSTGNPSGTLVSVRMPIYN